MPRFKTSDVADAETERCSFADLSLRAPLLRSLSEMGCEHPSPVQIRTLPAALTGKDVIVQAKSGTGKTIAFCSVLLQRVDTSLRVVQGLVLAPTREIALQVTDEVRRLGWYLAPVLSVACFIGGVAVEEDVERLEQGPVHIAVGTPGRTLKLLKEQTLSTGLRYLVLDEADKLLEHNFRQDITAITELVFNDDMQFLALSATFPPPLVRAAEELFIHVEKKHLKQGQPIMRELPQTVFLCTSAVKKGEDGRALAPGASAGEDESVESAVLKGVLHFRYVVQGYHVRQKVPALLEILTTAAYQQAFVFCCDSDAAVQVAEMLSQAGIPAAASSGRMDQSWRTQAFAGLKRCQYRVLVCTDLLARGVDVEKVDVVVNLDLPAEKETYLHRSGRTARFGSIGWSVSLVFEGDEDEHLSYFQMQLGFELADYGDREAAVAARLAALEGETGSQGALPPLATSALASKAAEPFVTPGALAGSLDGPKRPARRPRGVQLPEELECSETGRGLSVGSSMRVLSDPSAVLEACRAAGIGCENDQQRLASVGAVVKILREDPSDNTVKCRVPSVGKVWFAAAALCQMDAEEPARELPLQASAAFQSLEDVTVGSTVRVVSDAASVLQACREAGIGSEHDQQRTAAAGQTAKVLRTDPSDSTVKCNVPSIGKVWFALRALLPTAALPQRAEEASSRMTLERIEVNMQHEAEADQGASGAPSYGALAPPGLDPFVVHQDPWAASATLQRPATATAAAAATAAPLPAASAIAAAASAPIPASSMATPAVPPSPADLYYGHPVVHDIAMTQLLQQQQLLQQLLQQQQPQHQQPPAAWMSPIASAPGFVAAPRDLHTGLGKPGLNLPPFPPPPVLFPPPSGRGGASGPSPPQEVRALLPEWEPWMLDCKVFADYAAGGRGLVAKEALWPLGAPAVGSTRERLDALWAHHCRIWACE